MHKKFYLGSLFIVMGIIGIWQLANAATTWQGPPTNCAYPGQINCNTDGVVWNRSDANFSTVPAQIGNFKISGSGEIGNDFHMHDDKSIRIDKNGDSIIRIGNWDGVNQPNKSDLVIYGDLKVEKKGGMLDLPRIYTPWLCLNGDCRDVWPSGGGGGGTLTGITPGNGISVSGSAPSPTVSINNSYGFGCSNGQVRKWDGTSWGCSNDIVGTVGAGTGIVITGTAPNYTVNVDDERYLNESGDTATGYFQITAPGTNPAMQLTGATNAGIDVLRATNNGSGGNAAAFYSYNDGIGVFARSFGSNTWGWSGIFQHGAHSGTTMRASLGGINYSLNTTGNAYIGGSGNTICLNSDCRSTWPSGGGGITGVTAGTGLTGGGASGNVTLNLAPCANGQIYKSNGTSMTCQADAGLTSISVGTGLNVLYPSGPTPTLSISPYYQLPQTCSTGQVLQKTLGGWGCLTGGTGNLTKINAGLAISVSDPSGPEPMISVNYAVLDTKYAINSTLNSRYVTKTGHSDINGSLSVSNDINITGTGAVLYANNKEALWFNGTYFSWGYGGSANYFADNVGIGNSTPATRLQITGGSNVTVAGANTGYLVIGETNSTNVVYDDNEIQARNNGGADTLFLQHKGGDTWIGGALRYSSDERLKKEISESNYGLNALLKMRPVEYLWKNEKETKKHLGFIAQEMQGIIPEVVTNDTEDDMLGIAYTELIPVTIKAIQEQQETITYLQSQNDELRARNQDLEQRLQRLEVLMSTILQ